MYLPEEAEGSEIGFKAALAGGNPQLNMAYYDTDYTNLQASVFVAEGAGLFARLDRRAVPYGVGVRNFQSRTRLIDYDAGAHTADRGRRVGIQFNYFFGR